MFIDNLGKLLTRENLTHGIPPKIQTFFQKCPVSEGLTKTTDL